MSKKTYRGDRRWQAKQEFHAYGRKGLSWVDFWRNSRFIVVATRRKRKKK